MNEFWLGVLAWPAAAGIVAAVAGLAWAGSRALHWLILRLPWRDQLNDPDGLGSRARTLAVVAVAPRLFVLRLPGRAGDRLALILAVDGRRGNRRPGRRHLERLVATMSGGLVEWVRALRADAGVDEEEDE